MKWHILGDNEANLQLTAASANVQEYTNEKITLLIYLQYQYQKKIQSKPNNVRYLFHFNVCFFVIFRNLSLFYGQRMPPPPPVALPLSQPPF